MLKDKLALAGLIILLEGCGVFPGAPSSQPTDRLLITTSILDPTHTLRSMPEVVGYISHLNHNNPSSFAKLVDVSARAYRANPSESNKVRLGIILGSPHLLVHDNEENHRLLNELLDTEPALPDNLSAMVKLRLHDLEQHALADQENAVLRKEVDRHKLSMQQHMARSKDKISGLETALESAEAKLRALTSIEESITRNGTGSPDHRE